jgi:hypothetical protein
MSTSTDTEHQWAALTSRTVYEAAETHHRALRNPLERCDIPEHSQIRGLLRTGSKLRLILCELFLTVDSV